MKKLFFTLCLVGTTICLFGQTTITMQKDNGVYIVPCLVNGLKLKFIFDTGASDVSISLTEALFMLKNDYMKPEDVLDKEYYKDANGGISVGTKIIIRKIEFAGLTLNDVQASVVDNLEAPLLLGQTAISKLGTIVINPTNSTLTILNANDNINSTTSISLNENAGDFKFEDEVWDFKNIPQNQPVTHHFVFTNSGKNPIIITGVQSSCICVSPKWPAEIILPGKSNVISVTFNAAKVGNFYKSITLLSNAKTPSKIIYIKGIVDAGSIETIPK